MPERLPRAASALALTVLALAGCGGGNATGDTAPKPTASPTATPAATPSGPAALGTPLTHGTGGTVVTVTAYRVRSLRSTTLYGERSRRFVGVEARLCVGASSGGPVSISTQPWSIDYADDTTMDSISEWWDGEFTVPLYPVQRDLNVGQCVRGWIMFRPIVGGRAVRVTYTPGAGGPVSWQIPAHGKGG